MPAPEQVDDFVGNFLPDLVARAAAEAVALAMPMCMRGTDSPDGERTEVVQLMVASADGQRQTHAAEVVREPGQPTRFMMLMLVAEALAPVFERAFSRGLHVADDDRGKDQLVEVALACWVTPSTTRAEDGMDARASCSSRPAVRMAMS